MGHLDGLLHTSTTGLTIELLENGNSIDESKTLTNENLFSENITILPGKKYNEEISVQNWWSADAEIQVFFSVNICDYDENGNLISRKSL